MGVYGWKKRVEETHVGELMAEPGLQVKVMVAFSGPWLPLPRGTDSQWGEQGTGTR